MVILGGDAFRCAQLRAAFAEAGFPLADERSALSLGVASSIVVLTADGEAPTALCARVERWYADPDQRPAAPDGDTLVDGDLLVGQSGAMRSLRSSTARIAPTLTSVLLTGETGTGKELVAELIHRNSGRRGPLVAVNCAAIPDGLLESELFGYERGAFTGASGSYEGKLRLAHGGTVLLDEVGDMSSYAQAKMLRALETREAYRLGGRKPVAFDVRVIASTNEDLPRRVIEGRFRKDLYFRLNVARLHVPALRDRAEDVPLLLEHWRRDLRRRTGHAPTGFGEEAIQRLSAHDWPGNVRELRNLVEVLCVGASGRSVELSDLAGLLSEPLARLSPLGARADADAERERLLDALHRTHWNKSRAAEQLRWSRMTLYRKMVKYRIADTGGRAQAVATRSEKI